MGPTQNLVWKIYAGAVGAVTTIAAQKAIVQIWKAVSGEEPPEPSDPETPLYLAVSWALASGVGMALVQLMVNRFAARQWENQIGTRVPSTSQIKFNV